MKRILAMALTAICAVAMAETPEGNHPAVQPSNGQTNTATRAHRMLEKTGGAIIRPLPAGSKAIVFLDARANPADAAVLKKAVSRVEAMTSLYVKLETASLESYANTNGDVIVALVDGGDFSIYPEKMRAVVPAGDDLAAAGTAMWKATIALFSLYGKSVNDFHGMGIVRSGAEAYGIPQVQRVFYVRALEEGWAPPPANEFQRKLWDEHQAKKAAASGGADEK